MELNLSPTYNLINGDALAILKSLPDKTVQTIVTSPPYYLMRSYETESQVWDGTVDCNHDWGPIIPGNSRGGSGPNSKSKRKNDNVSSYARNATRGQYCNNCRAWKGELGLEPDPIDFIKHLTAIFREARRVLRDDGTLFLNIADTYVGETYKNHPWGLKQKDLYGIPSRLVHALQEDGWYYRNDAIWSKAGGNCPRCYYRIEKGSTKPESANGRCTRAHEYVFILAKSHNYYFDDEAIKEPFSSAKRRDVFYIPSQSVKGAHHATMPEALSDICIKGGSSEHGACAKCNAPYQRVIKKGEPDKEWQKLSGGNDNGEYTGNATKEYELHKAEDPSELKRRILAGMQKRETVGWEQTCKCKDPGNPVPCLVLDPFSGSGTTGASALKYGRNYLGIELVESNNNLLAKPRLDSVIANRKPPEVIEYLPLTSGIYHGLAETLLTRVEPRSVRLILTDPPFNVSRDNNLTTMNRRGIKFEWDGDFNQEEWIRIADKTLMPGGSIVIFNDWKNLGIIAHLLMDMGYSVKRNLYWKKSNPIPRNMNRSFVQATETALWAVKPGAKWIFNKRASKSYETGIFEYPVQRSEHESKKPTGLFQEIIEILSKKGDLILDPFVGSGTTAIASELSERRHISFEKNERFYNLAVESLNKVKK